MNELTLADLDMGTCLPQVLSTSKPTLDRRGTLYRPSSCALFIVSLELEKQFPDNVFWQLGSSPDFFLEVDIWVPLSKMREICCHWCIKSEPLHVDATDAEPLLVTFLFNATLFLEEPSRFLPADAFLPVSSVTMIWFVSCPTYQLSIVSCLSISKKD